MGDNAGRENQTYFLRRGIDRPQQATTCEPRPASARINGDLLHFREVDHQAAITGAETCKAMSSATDGSEKSGLRRGAHRALYVFHIRALRNQSGRAVKHAIPDAAGIFVADLAGTQQITFKSAMKRRVDLIASLGHLVLSLRRRLRRYRSEIIARKTANAGNDHCNPSTKNVVTEMARSSAIPIR